VNAETNTTAPATSAMNLPALKSLGELSKATPVLLIDRREQRPLIFARLQSIPATLPEGDIGIDGVPDWIVERKGTLDELASCCVGSNRDRFERELWRLRPYTWKRLLIVGATCERDILTHPYRSAINPRCVLGSLFTWSARFLLPYALVPTPESAARLVETWAFYWCKEKVHACNGLMRSHWRSAKARVPTAGDVDEPEEQPDPPET
jgi:hypothetical protein